MSEQARLRATLKAAKSLASGMTPEDVASTMTTEERNAVLEGSKLEGRISTGRVILFIMFFLWCLYMMISCSASFAS